MDQDSIEIPPRDGYRFREARRILLGDENVPHRRDAGRPRPPLPRRLEQRQQLEAALAATEGKQLDQEKLGLDPSEGLEQRGAPTGRPGVVERPAPRTGEIT